MGGRVPDVSEAEPLAVAPDAEVLEVAPEAEVLEVAPEAGEEAEGEGSETEGGGAFGRAAADGDPVAVVMAVAIGAAGTVVEGISESMPSIFNRRERFRVRVS